MGANSTSYDEDRDVAISGGADLSSTASRWGNWVGNIGSPVRFRANVGETYTMICGVTGTGPKGES